MDEPYDLIAIGSGTAAQTAINRVCKAGWRVAVIDHRPFGGTCALRGCDPKKMLVSGEEAIDAARRMCGDGVQGDLRIDWPALMAFKRSFTDPVPGKQENHYADRGVDAFHGLARFLDAETVGVGDRQLKARHVLIASGARPVPLAIPGEELVTTSDEFLELAALPRRIILIGGGYIAAEFSHLAARAGAEVTILQRGPRLLPRFDADVIAWLMPGFEALGITVETGAAVSAITRDGDGLAVHAGDRTFHAGLVIHAAGRAPDLDALCLASGDVAVEHGRLKLNEYLQSVSNPRVYGAGDAAGAGPPLTPVSGHDAKIVAASLLDGRRHKPDYRGVPSVVFTVPPVAMVGLGEAEARAQGMRFRVNAGSTPDWFTARRLNARIYGHKVLIDEGAGMILGAHLVGPGVDEVINLFALAIRHGLSADAIKSTMFAYPTGASDVGYML
ncbi:MAG: dihydrolipoyl dehydrogenase family protein [Sphingomicrobium sp.]